MKMKIINSIEYIVKSVISGFPISTLKKLMFKRFMWKKEIVKNVPNVIGDSQENPMWPDILKNAINEQKKMSKIFYYYVLVVNKYIFCS